MPGATSRALCWIRRDLRLSDHAALAAATSRFENVAMVFVFDTCILDHLENKEDRRLTFIHRSLQELNEALEDHGSKLVVLHGDPVHEIPKLAESLKAEAVFLGRDYEPYAQERDREVEKRLEKLGVQFHTEKDSVILEPGQVLSQGGAPLRVFTPYKNAWYKAFVPERDAAMQVPNLERLWPREQLSHPLPSLESLGFRETKLWLEPGQHAARRQLKTFEDCLDDYAKKRDFPAERGTSELSAHLRFGTISVRELVRVALSHKTDGSSSWLNELIWRDFYQDILWHCPEVIHRPFQPIYEHLEYPGTEAHFDAWRQGQTGYPIIDAAMRCFNATGWMHNRLRMVVASFLTKDLLVDYRKGERYFAEGLLDFDLASNNGGWQWAASVGADPQPYFRIFNPLLQSQRFDPDGKFIKEWCPELAELEGNAIHSPAQASTFDLEAAGVRLGQNYPSPIVDHAVQREKAVALLAAAKKS